MNFNKSIIQYVTTIQNLASQKDVREVINEIDIMVKILGTLPPKYNVLVTAWSLGAAYFTMIKRSECYLSYKGRSKNVDGRREVRCACDYEWFVQEAKLKRFEKQTRRYKRNSESR